MLDPWIIEEILKKEEERRREEERGRVELPVDALTVRTTDPTVTPPEDKRARRDDHRYLSHLTSDSYRPPAMVAGLSRFRA